MIKRSLLLIISFLIVNCFFVFSQSQGEIDSLLKIIRNSKQDSVKVMVTLQMGDLYEYSVPDSAMYFYLNALKLAQKSNEKKWIAKCYNYIGILNQEMGDFPKSLENYRKSYKIYEELTRLPDLKNKRDGLLGMGVCSANMGVDYQKQGNFKQALESFHKALKIYENIGEKKKISDCYINIGVIHNAQKSDSLALYYFQKALEIYEESGDKGGMSNCYNNIGIIYKNKLKYSLALENYKKSLKIYEEFGMKKRISQTYTNIGVLYYEQAIKQARKKEEAKASENYKISLEYYKKALKINEEMDDKEGIALSMTNIASLLNELKIYSEAITYATQSLEIACEIGSLEIEKSDYECLSNSYENKGLFELAFKNQKKSNILNDSLLNIESSKQLKEMEAVYQSEKKQLEIDNLTKDKALKDIDLNRKKAENKKQRIIIYSIILVLILVIIFSVLLYKQFTAKKKANILLAVKNIEIQQKNEEITSQRDEIETQRDLVINQKEELEEIHTQLTDSIRYAKRIQNAVLPTETHIKEVLSHLTGKENPDYFVIYKPRNIVSGDFYFVAGRNEWILLSVADCTGHGVPGAFMSMLGISFLNEIVAREDVQTASHVLNEMRKYIIKSLQQKNIQDYQEDNSKIRNQYIAESQSVKDGMDITFVAINTVTLKMQFAGANNPIYIVRKFIKSESEKVESEKLNEANSETLKTSELYELKGDKMPISIYVRMDEFTNHEIQLEKNDTIYLFSDGFSDQFGGPKGKKFLLSSLKQRITGISGKPMSEQKTLLENTLHDWRCSNGIEQEQTDDITILGLRI